MKYAVPVLAFLVGISVGGGLWNWWTDPITEVEYVDRPMNAGDVDLLPPTGIRFFERPDDEDTTEECVTVPRWLSEPIDTNPTRGRVRPNERDTAQRETSNRGTSTTEPTPRTGFTGNLQRRYVLLPYEDGRFAVSRQGRNRFRLNVVSPTTGAGRQIEYDLAPRWLWGPDLAAEWNGSYALETGLYVSRGTVSINAGMHWGETHSPYLGIRYRPTW